MTANEPAVALRALTHRFGERCALHAVTGEVAAGEMFGWLGPNGGGKTTLFRVLSTVLPIQTGDIRVFGVDLRQDPDGVRRRIGVTFQSPSLDLRLTVIENLRHHGHLYGLWGRTAAARCDEVLNQLQLSDRRADFAGSLSGGLKRRVEIAKSLLHRPQLLLLDEPSTGLDAGARIDLWRTLAELRKQTGVTILVTTHLMDEADRCDRLAILHEGQIVAEGTPLQLRSAVGGDCLTIRSSNLVALQQQIHDRFGLQPTHIDETLRIERPDGQELLRDLVTAFGPQIESITFGRPTLEDVFIQKTGRTIVG